MRYLFIAEKPSLMRAVKETYEKHVDEITRKVGTIEFTALAGHVCGNFEPNDYEGWDANWAEIEYPMLPNTWKIKAINDPGKKKIISDIKKSLPNYDGVIVGTDSDTEGYGIYYNLETYLGIQNKYALRFIEHDLTDPAILESLLTMTDYHTDPVHINFVKSYLLRNRADWLYGMNSTRIMTVKCYGNMMAIGRVKAPTIKLCYDNSMAIANFVPENYFEVLANYGTFKSTLIGDDDKVIKFKTENDIPIIPLTGIVKDYKKKQAKSHAPNLYDLSSIQVDAGKEFGYSPSETLDYVQSLYEKKYVSYPRTQCKFCSTEKAKEFPVFLSNMDIFENLVPFAQTITNDDLQRVFTDKKVVNDTEVNKESHDALLPTTQRPDLSTLSEEEINILFLLYKRVLANLMPEAIDDKVEALIEHGTYKFRAKGITVITQSWRALYKTTNDSILPELSINQPIQAQAIENEKKTTTPPKRLTQATLLAAMENIASILEDEDLKKSLAESKGIGTPATRAAIIDDIINRGYVDEKRGGLYITNTGISYIENLSGNGAESGCQIISPAFAAMIDMKIKSIQRGESSYEEQYSDIINHLYYMCDQMMNMQITVPSTSVLCARCNNYIFEERFNYRCPCCNFKIPKSLCKTKIDEKMLQSMMKGSPTDIKEFTKKDGTKFSARLFFDWNKNEVGFTFGSGMYCPFCGQEITSNKAGYFCNQEKGGCGFKLWTNMGNKKIAESDVKELFTKGKTRKISGFKNKEGKEFSAYIYLAQDKNAYFGYN